MLEQPPQGLEEQEELPGAGLPLPTTDRGEEGLALLDHWDSPSQSSHTVPWLGAPSARVQDCRPRSKPHQTAPGTSQCHPSTLCCPAEPCCPWDPCSPLLLIHQCRGMLQRELGVLLFRAGAERWSILFSWSFSHSDPMVQQRPVQGSVEAGEDLD